MHNIRMSKTLLTTIFLLLSLTFGVTAQGMIGVVEYIKTDDPEEFLSLEQEWHKVYKGLIKEEEIYGCSIFQVLYKTKDDDYNFIKILWFDAFSKINFRFRSDDYVAAYPDKDEKDWKDFQQRNKDNYEVLSSGVFQQEISLVNGLDQIGEFYRISEIHVQPKNSRDYHRLIEDVYLPVYKEDVKNNNRTVWSLWAKWTGSLDNFEYLTADGYTDMGQINQDRFADYFKTIHPDKSMSEVSDEMNELKVHVNSEMWKLIYRILE